MTTVAIGDRVKIHYTGKLEDGTVFDQSPPTDPLEFTAGPDGEVIEGLSRGVVGLAEGEAKTITVAPELAYGERQPDLEQTVPRGMIPAEVKEGDPVKAETEDGTVVVWVVQLDEETARVDANHPLAGRTLVFEVEVIGIEKAGGEEGGS